MERSINSRAVLTVLLFFAGAGLGCDTLPTQPDRSQTGRVVTAAPPPSVSSVTPNTGSTGGKTSLIVKGSGFLSGVKVTIDGVVVNAYRDGTGTTLYFLTPPHAAGPVDVVVSNADGQSTTASGGYTFAPPEAFDFNGSWYAYLNDGNDYPFSFKVENDALVSLTCYEGTPVPLASPVPVSHGEITASVDNTVIFSARIVAMDGAVGTINVGLCHSLDWVGWKDLTGTARRGAAVLGQPGRRK